MHSFETIVKSILSAVLVFYKLFFQKKEINETAARAAVN